MFIIIIIIIIISETVQAEFPPRRLRGVCGSVTHSVRVQVKVYIFFSESDDLALHSGSQPLRLKRDTCFNMHAHGYQ